MTPSLDNSYHLLMHQNLWLGVVPLDSNGTRSILIWSFVLIALLIVAFAGYSYLKKWMSDTEETGHGSAFGLSDLRELHKQGKISTEEFEQTRERLVAAAKRMTEKMPEVTPKRAPRTVPSAPASDLVDPSKPASPSA